jgi:surfeit locus 1 family protein
MANLGFEVVNPILINDKNYLINRGWIPFDKKRQI